VTDHSIRLENEVTWPHNFHLYHYVHAFNSILTYQYFPKCLRKNYCTVQNCCVYTRKCFSKVYYLWYLCIAFFSDPYISDTALLLQSLTWSLEWQLLIKHSRFCSFALNNITHDLPHEKSKFKSNQKNNKSCTFHLLFFDFFFLFFLFFVCPSIAQTNTIMHYN